MDAEKAEVLIPDKNKMDIEKAEDRIPYDVYKLTLEHYIDGETPVRIDEPIVVKMVLNRQYASSAVCLNKMMDMMKEYVLQKAAVNLGSNWN